MYYTLVDLLRQAAIRRPNRGVRLFRSGHESESVSYEELYEDAGQIASALMNRISKVRYERVALLFPSSGDYLRAFFGVLAAGAVPVPLPSPLRFSTPKRFAERICGALLQSRIRIVIGSEKMIPILRAVVASLNINATILSITDLRLEKSPDWSELSPHDPALIQYTSGSTASPKGVILTHGQILANLDAIGHTLNLRDDDIGCSWLPLFHDMGLIGCLLGAVYGAIDLLLMPPEDFILDPLTWLFLIHRYRATLSAAPNSAYFYCARRMAQHDAKTLDLSCWRVAMNGSEMVDAATIRDFMKQFQPVGFRPEAMLPVYGLAEASLAVTFPPLERGVRSVWVRRITLSQGIVQLSEPGGIDSREVVSVGRPVTGMEICLLGRDGQGGFRRNGGRDSYQGLLRDVGVRT